MGKSVAGAASCHFFRRQFVHPVSAEPFKAAVCRRCRDNRRVELILVVVGAILVTALAHRRGLEPALIIVVIGSAVSFLPDFKPPELDSHILLTVVLPPLLYSAALDFSFPTFLRNIRPILGLGVGLVIVSAFAVAAISAWLGGV